MPRRNPTLAALPFPIAVALACLWSSASIAETAEKPSVYQVGVAKVDVTPGYPVRLNGFGNRRAESEGVTQRIWAKALAIDSGDGKPVVLITLDNLGIRQSMVDEVARRLQEKHGLARQRIAVTFTHSHTTPKVNGACDTIFSSPIPPEHQAHIDRYTAELTDWLEEVAETALADLKPATLSWAVGKVTFAKNRRTPGGPVDHDLPVLVVRSADDDRIRAIYTTYACHCVTLSDNKVSGDWAGFAQHAIEMNHPGAIALVSIGCGSDSNPESGVTGGNYAAAADQGAQIADEIERMLGGSLTPIAGPLAATFSNIDLPLKPPPTKAELAEQAKRTDAAGYNARFQLERLKRGEPLQTKIEYPVQTLAFGDSLAMVFLGGEICVDYALRLKRELDAERLWLHGYSNDFCSYIPSERLLQEGGYGGGGEIHYFALPSTLQAGLEDRILAEVHRQVPERFKSQAEDERQSSARQAKLEQALASIKVKDGFVVEIAAAEPLVADPVAIDFGPDGRLWVAEMPDYTRFVDEPFEPSGNVRVLTDRDGDGRYDEAVVFADGLRFPTDVKVWRRGVIVCDAPDVLYLEDADGDGKAEIRKRLLTGFATHNAQARVNSLRWGLDNWLYGSCGLFGGEIKTHTGRELALGERDFRFRPDTGEIEGVTGRTQQGRARSDWGDWFGCENGSLVDHYPLVDRYLARNPHVAPPATEVSVPAGKNPAQLYPIGTPSLFALSGPSGRPTSVCGLEIYRDELLGAEYAGNLFVAEPVNHLVHRRVLSARGTTFTGERATDEQETEFLASTDPWFRPVQIRTGLDGCLYVVDMHRAVIEHPKFIPEESLRELDVMGGRDEGRIYRVRPKGARPREAAALQQLSAEELAAAMDSPNGPLRDLAQQMLVTRRAEAAPALSRLAAAAKRPAVRQQALCTLEGLQALEETLILGALRDEHAAVRRHAIRLSEPFLASAPRLAEAVLKLAADDDPHVRQQLAYTLGEVRLPGGGKALADMALTGQSDPYLLAAVWSSVSRENVAAVVERLIDAGNGDGMSEPLADVAFKLLVELGEPADLAAAGARLSNFGDEELAAWRFVAAARLLEAAGSSAAGSDSARKQLDGVVARARRALESSETDEPVRLAALRSAAAAETDRDQLMPLLTALLQPTNPPSMQNAAIELLAATNATDAREPILAGWESFTADVRETAFDVIMGDEQFAKQFLTTIAAGEISANSLNALQRQRLLEHADEAVRGAASSALAGAIDGARQKIVDEYAAALSGAGDAGRGRQLFAAHCASCHLLEGVGHAVGPDLAALTTRTPAELLQSMLDPNRDIDERYRSYTAVTIDGLAHTGILAGETSTSITLLEQQGKQHTLLRADLELLHNTGKSLMPDGLERDVSPSEAADLVAYLTSAEPESKLIAENVAGRTLADTAPVDGPDAAGAIAKLLEGLAVGTPAEYERIPAIWEAALAAGRRNQASELVRLLDLSLPKAEEPLRDWQAVVIGGGVINGLSQQGAWPRERIAELLKADPRLKRRWQRSIELAAKMADDGSIRTGTRYDALRMLGAVEFAYSGAQLMRYLADDAHAELQMGAVSGLSDVNSPLAAATLIDGFAQLTKENQQLAIAALMRTEHRRNALSAAVRTNQVPRQALSDEQSQRLTTPGEARSP